MKGVISFLIGRIDIDSRSGKQQLDDFRLIKKCGYAQRGISFIIRSVDIDSRFIQQMAYAGLMSVFRSQGKRCAAVSILRVKFCAGCQKLQCELFSQQ